jgi:AAA domain
MRIERIKLRDFRGVTEQEVTFNTTGVTVIEGDNEAGKTSVADAFDLLRRWKDSSGRQEIKEAKPVNRDVGPFVEATFTVGEYRMTYRKQWISGKLTELEIHAPHSEQLSGDQAHERVEQLLRDHADMTLFDSLWYRQGDRIAQAELAGSKSLLSALDAAADDGGEEVRHGAQDELLKRVGKERERYWTGATGKEIKDRTTRRQELAAAQSRVEALQQSLARLEQTADAHAAAERELLALQQRELDIERQVTQARAAVARLEGLRTAVGDARAKDAQATLALSEATRDLDDVRAELIRRVATDADSITDLQEQERQAAPQLDAAEAAVTAATEARASAQASLNLAQLELSSRRAVAELLHERAAYAALSERSQRLEQAEVELTEATRALESIRVTPDLVRDINAAHGLVDRLRARVEAGQARVRVEARRELTVAIGAERRQIQAGAEIETPVSGALEIDLPDIARIVVSSPEQSGGAELELQTAQGQLNELLEQSGVDSHEAAAAALEERGNQTHNRERAGDRRAAALAGLEPSQLAAQLERARQRTAVLEPERGEAAAELQPDEADALVEAAGKEMERLHRELAAAQVSLDSASSALKIHAERAAERRGALERLTAASQAATAALEAARAQVSDASLQEAVDAAAEAAQGARKALAEAEQALHDANADALQAELDNKLALSGRNATQLVKLRDSAVGSRALLESEGHSGLSDRLARELAERDTRAQTLAAEDRRADAAALLYETLVRKRKAAHAVHAQPFREQLLRYARIVWGPDVEVVIDPETFQILSVSRDGVTIPFAGLSAGTREQFAILARLAVAAIVGTDGGDQRPGGVPVIIDDALGYSDPGRLTKLGAAFSVAGRESQVIVLTCVPDRYRDIGNAESVKIG